MGGPIECVGHRRTFLVRNFGYSFKLRTDWPLLIDYKVTVFSDSMPKVPLMHVIEWSWMSANVSLEIVRHLNAIPLFVQITQIVGGVLVYTQIDRLKNVCLFSLVL